MKKTNEKEYNIYIKGFEEGYAMAKRLYKPLHIYMDTESYGRTYLKQSETTSSPSIKLNKTTK